MASTKESITKDIVRICVPFEAIYTSVFIVSTDEGVALLDCATTRQDVEAYILPALAELRLVPDLIVASHSHGDHMGGMPHLAGFFPAAKLAMVSQACAERYPAERRHILHDGERLLGCLRVLHLSGHCRDAIAILDERTKTLLTFDCLQAQGVDRFGTGLEDVAAYIKTVDRISAEDIELLVASHEYVPTGSIARGKREIDRYLTACREDIHRICTFVSAHPDDTTAEICSSFQAAYPHHPTVHGRTFEAVKIMIERGNDEGRSLF